MDTEKKFNVSVAQQKNLCEVKASKKRWLILAIFIYYGAFNSFQWIEYAIITNIVMKYYNVSSVMVDWTSIIYMALYCPLAIPASYIVDKKGLRIAALIGGLGTAMGTVIKVLSIGRDLFYVVLIGQSILATSQAIILCLPPRIAAVWFKPNEASTACSLGVFGTQLGIALGFVIPPIIVKNHSNSEQIGPDLRVLCWSLSALIMPGALAIVFLFSKQPDHPPSSTQLDERNKIGKYTLKDFILSLKALLKNGPFVVHVIAYGINVAVFCVISTFLNQIVLQYFENAEEDAGRMGLVMIVMGIIGSILFGILLDKTHKYKQTTFVIYLMTTISVIAIMFSLEMKNKLFVYISMGCYGLFANSYMPVGFEFGMELTFPSPESTTTGILLLPSQILGVILTLIIGKLHAGFGPFWALTSQAVLLIIGTFITAMVPNILKRQEAFQKHLEKIEFGPLRLATEMDE